MILVFFGLSTSLSFGSDFSYAQGPSTVTGIAKQITVRIEGATQGSGVLIGKQGNIYTLLTAFHVISSNKPGEEIVAITSDGSTHDLNLRSFERIYQTDLALLQFTSSSDYLVGKLKSSIEVSLDDQVLVSGFPVSGNGENIISKGVVRANASMKLSNGYQLIYDNYTAPGMSGGPILAKNGLVIGIHGRGEKDNLLTQVNSSVAKTGFNQGVPIDHYLAFNEGNKFDSSSGESVDNYLVQAEEIVSTTISGSEKTVLRLLSQVEDLGYSSARVHFLKSLAYHNLLQYKDSLQELNKCIVIEPLNYECHINSAVNLGSLRRYPESVDKSRKALSIIRSELDKSFDLKNVLSFVHASINHAIALDNVGDVQAAKNELYFSAKIIKAIPNEGIKDQFMPPILYRIFSFAKAEREFDVAEQLLFESISIRDNWMARAGLGNLYMEQKKYHLASGNFQKAISMNPYEKNIYYNYARLLYAQRNISGAIDQLNKSLSLDNSYLQAINLQSRLYRQSGETINATKLVRRSLQLDDSQSYPYHERGLINQKAGNFDMALSDYNIAISIDPSIASYHGNKASVLMQTGRMSDALLAIDKAIELNPEDGSSFSKRAMVKILGLKDKKGGCLDLAKAHSLGDANASKLLSICN